MRHARSHNCGSNVNLSAAVTRNQTRLKPTAYTEDFLHVIPSKLLIPEETLNTSEMNQNRLTIPPKGELPCVYVNCRVVAVTLEKKVAIVVILTYRVVALSFSSDMNFGKAILDQVSTM